MLDWGGQAAADGPGGAGARTRVAGVAAVQGVWSVGLVGRGRAGRDAILHWCFFRYESLRRLLVRSTRQLLAKFLVSTTTNNRGFVRCLERPTVQWDKLV